MLRIGLDIDDTIATFWSHYINKFGNPKSDFEITKNVQRKLRHDKKFWTGLDVANTIDFVPELYCTKRVNPKSYTKQWLIENGFPNRPIYQMYLQTGNKATMIKGRVDVFIDDSISNFKKLNESGVPCLLIDAPQNQGFETSLRIYSLNYNEILTTYNNGFNKD